MKKFFINHGWWITCILSIVLLIAHTFSIAKIKVDSTSIILLAILLLSPFISALKKIKVGDFEAEIDTKEIKKIKEEVENRLPVKEDNLKIGYQFEITIENIKQLAKTDRILALAKLRIELEKSLNRLYQLNNLSSKNNKMQLPLGRLVYELTNKDIISQDVAASIRDVTSICNRAIHGEDVRVDDAMSIIDIGASLLLEIHFTIAEYCSEPNEVIQIAQTEVDEHLNARYQITTICPRLKSPEKYIRILDQEGLDSLLEGYNEYAEFIVGVQKL